jgi:hypothetical protein
VAAAQEPRLLELARAHVAEEVVARADLVDAEALGAGVALADVALQERVIVDNLVPPAVLESALCDGSPTGLTAGGGLHERTAAPP